MSIHQRDLETWNERAGALGLDHDPGLLGRNESIDRQVTSPLVLREVHGFHPYWMGNSYLDYDWSALTTVAFFSLELDGTGAIVNSHGWPWTTLVNTAHAHGVRVIVTASLFSSSALDQLLASTTNRANAVANLTAAVVSGNADGVNVDFENVPGARKADLVSFLGELRTSLQSAIANPYLSIATPAVDWNNAFDYDELAARCDHLMVMAYDYHWSGSSTSGPVAPASGWGTYNVDWTLTDYQTWGATPDKMILGVPYYGYRWQTASDAAGAATVGTGSALVYSAIKPEADQVGWIWDSESSTPWYRYQDNGDWFQGWYDDEVSLSTKYSRVLFEGLAGVGIWALGYDGTRPELWNALHQSFSPVTSTDLCSTTHPALFLVGPNPFRDQTRIRVESASGGTLTIHDITGRRVRTLESARESVLSRVFPWNGRDDSGRRVAPGVYYVKLASPTGDSSLRIVHLR